MMKLLKQIANHYDRTAVSDLSEVAVGISSDTRRKRSGALAEVALRTMLRLSGIRLIELSMAGLPYH